MSPRMWRTLAGLLILVASVASNSHQNANKEVVIKCNTQEDCWGKNAHCSDGRCTCSWGFTLIEGGDCFLEEEHVDEELLRERRSSDGENKLDRKLMNEMLSDAAKHGYRAVVHNGVQVTHRSKPLVYHFKPKYIQTSRQDHGPATPLVHHNVVGFHTLTSRHRRTPGTVSKIERKIIKSQLKKQAKKQSRKLVPRAKRGSNEKIAKLERKLVKEQVKQAKKDAKKGRVAVVPVSHVPVSHVPVVYHQPLVTRFKRDSREKIAKLERKLVKEQVKQAKKDVKKGRVAVVPVSHVAVSHVPVVYHQPLITRPKRDSREKVAKLERKLVKEQVKQAKKDAKKGRVSVVSVSHVPVYRQPLITRLKRDSHEKIAKLERKLVKEQVKQAKKEAKKGRVALVPVAHTVVHHRQPVVYTETKTKTKSGPISRSYAKVKSYLG